MKAILNLSSIIILFTTISFADTINIPADIDSIQGGINLANPGDTVLVQPGTYVENINFNGKNIVVGSLTLTTGDTSYISQTVIDGDSSGSVVRFENGEDSTTVFCGFTITNGYGLGGGGIHMYNSSPFISQLIIINNSSSHGPWGGPWERPFGGGIYFENSNAQVSQVKVLSNSASARGPFMSTIGIGGGIYSINSNPILTDVEIKNNSALGAGGGIYFKNSNAVLTNIEIFNNQGGNGGGISCVNSNPIIQNTTVSSNEASGHYGVGARGGGLGGGIYIIDDSSPTLSNVLILNNSTVWGDGEGGGIFCQNSNPLLNNVVIKDNYAGYGGGICGGEFWNNDDDSNLSLSNVTIKNNTARYFGGGILFGFYSNSHLSFDPVNRCNIYFNQASIGNDLYYYGDSTTTTTIVVDTFTVMNPNNYFAYPDSNFVFDILNAKVEQVNSDLYVNPNGDDENSGLSPAEPLKTINIALMKILSDSLEPHGIYLSDGEYSPSTTGEIYPLNMRNYVSLHGESETGVILNGDSTNVVIKFYMDRAITIEYLTISGGGTGIECLYSSPNISNVTVTENSGDGIWCGRVNPSISNLTIANNSGNGIKCHLTSLCLVNTILWNNSLGSIYIYEPGDEVYAFYSDIQGGWPGEGNIDADPMFVDTTNGNYRLQAGSPCIDAGIQDTMIIYNNGQDTLIVLPMAYIGSAPDMGAYEYDPSSNIKQVVKIPLQYSLKQNYPNPFNPSTTIEFTLPKSEYVELKVYNILGKEVATLVSKNLNSGNHTYTFDDKNLASGIYYYQLVAGDYREVKKMILIK